MANRIFIIPRRNDLAGMSLSLGDLAPNAGQKNSIYAGAHQNVYLQESIDALSTDTVVNSLAWVSGSLNTQLAAGGVDDDTTGGGDDVSAVAATTFGLAAYILDRVQDGGVALATASPMPFADANTIAQDIMDAAFAGNALTLTAINTIIANTAANSDLDGSSGNSRSFGSVEDVLRILSGEVYRLPALTILGEDSGGSAEFYTEATRQALVDAQTVSQVTAQGQFYAKGSFLSADDAGYRARPELVRTGALNLSLGSGVLSEYTSNATEVAVVNPSFAYSAGAVKPFRPRATFLDTSNVPATGLGILCRVYLNDGTNLG